MKSLKVNFIYRKSRAEYHSIERVFESLVPDLSKQIEIERHFLSNSGGSPKSILKNLINLKVQTSEINHITGDAHYVCMVTGKKSILTIHDVKSALSSNPFKNFYIKLMWFWIPSLIVRRITVISEFTKRELESIIPFSKKKIVVVPNPINENFGYSPKTFNSDCPNILLIGTKFNKNLERSIEAISQLQCSITIIGRLTKHQSELLATNEIDFENKFNITDNDMLLAYKKADIICFPSTYEGFGMPIIEAQALGRPILTSNIEPMNMIAGGGACLIDPLNVDSIRDGLKLIIDNKNYRNMIITEGLKNASRFSRSQIVKKYLKIYKSVESN